MKPKGARASRAHRDWTFDARPDGILVLRLSGRWLMQDHLPPRAAIERELAARPTARVLAFDTQELPDAPWQSREVRVQVQGSA